jgi:nitroreductase
MNHSSREPDRKEKTNFIPLSGYHEYSVEEMKERASAFLDIMQRRRSVRQFSDREVPREIIESCLAAAGTAPSGANLQPWHFVVVSDPDLKNRIADAAEREERIFYSKRAPKEWLKALKPLGTDVYKPFLKNAPYLIVVFQKRYGILADGSKLKYYYTAESVGIATGILITALHQAGLVSLPHTPSPMGFLNEILDRPENESAYLILVVGYPENDAVVPDIRKKPMKEIVTFL